MTTQPHLIIIGGALKKARQAKGLKQREVSAAYKRFREQHLDQYIDARAGISNFDLSKLESSQLTDKIAKQKRQTVEVLAAIFGVEVSAISTAEQPLALPASPDKSEPSVKDLGLATELPTLTLPFTPVRARAAFILSCGTNTPPVEEETIGYVLPPRPITDYVNKKSRVFEARGDSMAPEISSGERVIADFVPVERWELLVNCIVVICYDEYMTIRWIKENELLGRRVLTLYPNRPDLAPLTVRRELIKCIYQVTESFERKKWA